MQMLTFTQLFDSVLVHLYTISHKSFLYEFGQNSKLTSINLIVNPARFELVTP